MKTIISPLCSFMVDLAVGYYNTVNLKILITIIQNCHRSHTKWPFCMTQVEILYDIHISKFTVNEHPTLVVMICENRFFDCVGIQEPLGLAMS